MGSDGCRSRIKNWVLTDPFFVCPGISELPGHFFVRAEKYSKGGLTIAAMCGIIYLQKRKGEIKMNYKERVLYNSLLFEQIKSILIAEELNIYDNSMVLKDIFGNCLKIEIFHFKNGESFETYKAIKESAKLEEELKNRKKGEIK